MTEENVGTENTEGVELPTLTESMFDFMKTDDLPESLQKAQSAGNADKVKKVVAILTAAPRPLCMGELQIVFFRMYNEEPVQATFRAWLNKAKAENLIYCPSRQTYASGAAPTPAEPELDAPIEPNTNGSDDLLGDLGSPE